MVATIAERITLLVEKLEKGNKSEFARKVGVTPAYISKLGKEPDRVPSERVINDICDAYPGVNRLWLETGADDPFRKTDIEKELGEIFGEVLSGDPSTRSRFIRAFARLPEEAYPILEQLIIQMVEEIKRKEDSKTE